ncbi:serine/threonine-protein kinase [Pseudonocardia zijingensis]|uniref:non-specific serine/threonine protein kinase n=1 Tax=Pseudonocardia zijingensis TaxID=153376 RepID=A0ABN1PRT4_9PSEU
MTADRTLVLGPYRLEGLLGRGGMGEVYRAFDQRRGRAVALKVLPAELAHDEDFRTRFRRESDSAARLQDPHVVPIHDFGEIDGRLFIDMRLIDGVGLDRIIASGPMDPRRAVALVSQVAEALTDAHAHGVLHRDVKPSNVLVTPSDFAYLVDFGIARALDEHLTAVTRSGSTVGTLAYMAPERFDGGAPDHRSDIYSLACTLAECLTGRRPFDGTSLPSIMKAHLTADPPRPSLQRGDVPPALDEVIARGMAKDPAARYATARDLAAAAQYALQQWDTPPVAAPAPPAPTATLPSAPRGARRVLVLATAAVVLAVVSGGAGFAAGRASAPTEAVVAAGPATAAPTSAAAPTPQATVAPPTAAAAPTTGPGPFSRVEGDRPASYVYTVEANYPVTLSYTDSNGDRITVSSVPAPWNLTVDTSAWGADATPLLSVVSPSTKGDTTVTCSISDDSGRVLATQTKESAFAAASCMVYS